MVLNYIVVPFVFARKGKIVPGSPQIFAEKEKALLSAATRSITSVGVIVLEESSDEAAEIFREPRLIAQFGKIPLGFSNWPDRLEQADRDTKF